MNDKKLEIYIHIPFCIKKCNYCDFLSFAADDYTKAEYCRALMREIDMRSQKISDDFIVDTIFFGGGTPSCIDAVYIAEIMEHIKDRFKIDDNAEITIECNPGTLDRRKLLIYKEAGINRISIGLQSTDDSELKMLGRIHTYEEFKENYELARNVGFDNINIDLMSALPRQTKESYAQTLDRIVRLEPDHISAYSLIVEENTPMYDMVYGERKNPLSLPGEEEEREMYYDTERILGKAGYTRYEISNYSKGGCECRHNIGYWTRKDYVGFGIGAASFLNETRYTNCSDIEKYIKNSDCAEKITENIEALTEKEQMEEFMFLGLRMMNGISKKEFEHRFSIAYDDVYGKVSSELSDKKLLIVEGDNVRLTKKGVDVSNYVFGYFLHD